MGDFSDFVLRDNDYSDSDNDTNSEKNLAAEEPSAEAWTCEWAGQLSDAFRHLTGTWPFFNNLSFGEFCQLAYAHTTPRTL